MWVDDGPVECGKEVERTGIFIKLCTNDAGHAGPCHHGRIYESASTAHAVASASESATPVVAKESPSLASPDVGVIVREMREWAQWSASVDARGGAIASRVTSWADRLERIADHLAPPGAGQEKD